MPYHLLTALCHAFKMKCKQLDEAEWWGLSQSAIIQQMQLKVKLAINKKDVHCEQAHRYYEDALEEEQSRIHSLNVHEQLDIKMLAVDKQKEQLKLETSLVEEQKQQLKLETGLIEEQKQQLKIRNQ